MEMRPVIGLPDVEYYSQCDTAYYVLPFTLSVDELWCYQVVVDEEYDEEGQELLPNHQDLIPVKGHVSIGDAHAETDYRSYEQHGP